MTDGPGMMGELDEAPAAVARLLDRERPGLDELGRLWRRRAPK